MLVNLRTRGSHTSFNFMGVEYISPKLPISVGYRVPRLIHGSLALKSPYPIRHLDRIIRFCRTDWCDQQTRGRRTMER